VLVDPEIPITIGQRVEPDPAHGLCGPFKASPGTASNVEDTLPFEERPRQTELVSEKLLKVPVLQSSAGTLSSVAPELELSVALRFELVEHMPADSRSYSLKLRHDERVGTCQPAGD
jgi:hypothetical protein